MIHDATGYWLREAGPTEPFPALEGRQSADVVVVGGGYTGMWAAWLIKELEPEARVVVLEAGVCGGGPSGRNGGFVNEMWFSVPALRERFGDTAAIAVARAAADAVGSIGRWCEEQEVDAWFRPGGYLQVSTAPAWDGAWDETAAACAELGAAEACRPLTAEEVRERCNSPLFRSGAFYPGAATVQPARLARGLRARLAERGVSVCERSRVRRLRVGRDGVAAETPGGQLVAASAVLAAGPALAALAPLRRRLTLTSSHMVITEPVPDLLEEIGWTGGECITDSRALINYMRTTPDGRIAFGWGGGRVLPGVRLGGRAELDRELADVVADALRRFFPALAGSRMAHAWGGPIDVSPTHLPIVGSLDGAAHFATGFTGNGVGPSRMLGRVLASLALDRRDEPTRLAVVEPPPVRVPPEPFRYAGGVVVRNAMIAMEAAQEGQRRPGPLSRFVAALPRRIGIHVGR